MEMACMEGIWLSVCPFCKTLFQEETQEELLERCQIHARGSRCSSDFDRLPTLLDMRGSASEEPAE